MLVVIAEVRVGEGAVEALREAIGAMETESRKEPGCQRYAFSTDISDPTLVRITELWDSAEDLQKHFTMPHMAVFGAAMGNAEILSMDVQAYELGAPVPMPGG